MAPLPIYIIEKVIEDFRVAIFKNLVQKARRCPPPAVAVQDFYIDSAPSRITQKKPG